MQACALPLGALTRAAVRWHIDTQFCSDQACADATPINRAMIETKIDFHIGSPPCGSVVSLNSLLAQFAATIDGGPKA